MLASRLMVLGVAGGMGIALAGSPRPDPGPQPVPTADVTGSLPAGLEEAAHSEPGSDQIFEPDAFVSEYCERCHNAARLARGTVPFAFQGSSTRDVSVDAEAWEKVVEKLRLGMMPPIESRQPTGALRERFVTWLETELDAAAAENPDPGRPTVRPLTTAEYINAVRDLLGLEVNEEWLLFPDQDADEEGFTTNGDVLAVSPALFDRFMSAANRISRLAVGDPTVGPGFTAGTYRLPSSLYQDDRMSEDLPFGSRGGVAVDHFFPLDGEYEVKIELARQQYQYVVGMGKPQELDVRLDGQLLESFTVGDADRFGHPAAYTFFGASRGDPDWEEYMSTADADLIVRFPAEAGSHTVQVSFARARTEPSWIPKRRESGFALSLTDDYLGNARVGQVEIRGPYQATGPGETRSRQAIFSCTPNGPDEEEACARQILTFLARRAYRRPVTPEDVRTLMSFYQDGWSERGFEYGVQKALERLLVAPDFLFLLENEPEDVTPGEPYRVSDVELASRLSFFLWSSIPDEELLRLAEENRLRDPVVLERQVRRMLADPKAVALVENFMSQWLRLGRLRGITPDPELFFEFDENLRQGMELETFLFLEDQLRQDRSVRELLTADYTFLNERLARHYGIPGVYGERLRRVAYDDVNRRGLLGHGSIQLITAYPNRTSPVLRGKWVLDNLLGHPPPPPPPNVPDLEENHAGDEILSLRERMEQHRADPACAVCHRVMDPLGFALETFDPIGRWREFDESGDAIDPSAVLADGSAVASPGDLVDALARHEESIAVTVAEKLLTYALGRTVEYYDQPAIRRIVSDAAQDDFPWSAIILGVVKSTPFQMRSAES